MHLESDNCIDGMDREGKGEGKREETKEMGTMGNRGLKMHLHLKPSVLFFFISLFISTYTYSGSKNCPNVCMLWKDTCITQ